MNEEFETVQIAFQLPIDGIFSYHVSKRFMDRLVLGSRVFAPFRNKIQAGFIVGLGPLDGQPDQLREISLVLDEKPSFNQQLWNLLCWASDYYMVPIGLALKTALPSGSDRKSKPWAILTASGRLHLSQSPAKSLPPSLNRLMKRGVVPLSEIVSETESSFIKEASKKGFIIIEQRITPPRRRLGKQYLPELLNPSENESDSGQKVTLTVAQQNAVDSLDMALEKADYQPFLLFGVTGSGKTEVYLKAIEKALSLGKRALTLVPEIALTPQTARIFLSRFGGGIALFHSKLTDAQKLDEWRRVASGSANIVIAARSGIFLPIPDLGLIIVDEEHDNSYKQEDAFPYNARDLALLRGKLENLCVILGSATPSLETFVNVKNGKINRLDLPSRPHGGPLPKTEILDLKSVFPLKHRKNFLTPNLIKAISKTLEENGQVALFLNRRGFDTLAQCSSCGTVLRCPNCDISLTHHKKSHDLRCHMCGYARTAPPTCPSCSSEKLVFSGVGTQKVEESLIELFPEVRIERLDRDSTMKRDSLDDILKRFRNKEIDILTGTQMIVKGHDFPGISLVGVLCGDSSLHFPDFRASEHTFQTLVQVSGRTGRESAGGTVLLQTFDPEHYAIQLAATHDYDGFFEKDSVLRRELFYPPYGHLILIKIQGSNQKKVEEKALQIGRQSRILKKPDEPVSILGPAPSPRKKALGKHRWQIILKSQSRNSVRNLVKRLNAEGVLTAHGMSVSIDVDPVNLV
jgi:primosomal protein N' (replication factor Y)